MDTLNALLDGFGSALTPINLMDAVLGVLLGTAVCVLPGIGPAIRFLRPKVPADQSQQQEDFSPGGSR